MRMMIAEVAGMEGVGGELSGLIVLWKSVEKWKTTLKRPGRAATAKRHEHNQDWLCQVGSHS